METATATVAPTILLYIVMDKLPTVFTRQFCRVNTTFVSASATSFAFVLPAVPLSLWCFHLTMCPYQVGCNLIFNRYILKVPFSECSFIIPSEYFLSIITRLHLSHLIPIFWSATAESSPHTKYSIINLLHFLHLISITFPLFNSVRSLFIQNHQSTILYS